MPDTISVLVRADAHRGTVDLLVEGILTERASNVLVGHITRACGLDPSAQVLVDLTSIRYVDAGALDLLHSAVERETRKTGRSAGVTVRLLDPEATAASAEKVASGAGVPR